MLRHAIGIELRGESLEGLDVGLVNLRREFLVVLDEIVQRLQQLILCQRLSSNC